MILFNKPLSVSILPTILILITITVIGCKNKTEPCQNIKLETISIDNSQFEKITDASSFIDTDEFEFIPIKTSDSCLIGQITKVYLRKNKIIIYDEREKQAVILNRDGSYHAKVHAIGKGLGEYPPVVNDIVVTDTKIGVLTPMIGKILFYDFDGKYIEDISILGSWGHTFFSFDEKTYYLVNDWSTSSKGNNHLYRIKKNKNDMESFLPFNEKETNRGWGLKNYYSKIDNHALLLYSSIDTIFSVTPNSKIEPKYYVDIKNKKLPDIFRIGDGYIALETASSNDYITGINKINESSNYLILNTSDSKYILYDKNTKQVKFYSESFNIPSWGNYTFGFNTTFVEGDAIIFYLEANLIQFALKDVVLKTNYENKRYEQKLKNALNKIKSETDNPVLFLTRFKNK